MAFKDHPINHIKWIPVGDIQANTWNPNAVAKVEMGLLALSIREDGFTQPVVVTWDEELKKYVVVDGFHRFTTVRLNEDIRESTEGCVPCVVLVKDVNQRMAATVRHNRARGKHSLDGMSNMVFEMLKNGMSDTEICNKLGMDEVELSKLKHITGFSKLFEDTDYGKSWKTSFMVQLEKEQERLDNEQAKASNEEN